MKKNIFLALVCCAASFATQAGLIQFQDYSRLTTSSVVKTKQLEWLQWDQTRGMSIKTALETYSNAGWTLASSGQMVALFNDFKFGHSGWKDAESKNQVAYQSWSADEASSQNAFLRLFGINRTLGCDAFTEPYCYPAQDPHEETFAFFGSDANQNGRFNLASVRDDLTEISPDEILQFDAFSRLSADNYSIDQAYGNVGVALVRTVAPTVSVPATSGLLLLAWSLFVWFRRRSV